MISEMVAGIKAIRPRSLPAIEEVYEHSSLLRIASDPKCPGALFLLDY